LDDCIGLLFINFCREFKNGKLEDERNSFDNARGFAAGWDRQSWHAKKKEAFNQSILILRVRYTAIHKIVWHWGWLL